MLQYCDMNALRNDSRPANGLRLARIEAGLSQAELARRSGVARTRIIDYEKGRIDLANATVRTAGRLAKALGTTIDRLAGDDSR